MTAHPPLADGYHSLPPGKIAAIVTYLEMGHPPDWIEDQPEQNLLLVEQTAPDPVWYINMFKDIGTPYLWTSRLRLDGATLRATLTEPGRRIFKADLSGQTIGLVELMHNGSSVEIGFFGLKPGQTGRGLGRSMMAAALKLAWQGETKRVWLHTCTFDHPYALRFYQQCGFRPISFCVEVMDDPRLTGLLPETSAPHIPLVT